MFKLHKSWAYIECTKDSLSKIINRIDIVITQGIKYFKHLVKKQ